MIKKEVIKLAVKNRASILETLAIYNTMTEKIYSREHPKFCEMIDYNALEIVKRYYRMQEYKHSK